MRCRKLVSFLFFTFSFYSSVLSHELPKQGHDHYSFKVLQEAVNGDSLMPDDVERLLSKLQFWNCSTGKNDGTTDHRKCLDSSEIYNFAGSSPSNLLNATDFAQVSPLIVYCLLPAPEKNPGRCEVSPKNPSELFNSFSRNFSQHGGRGNITRHALDRILEAVNETIGNSLTRNKCFSAENIFEELEEEHHEEPHGEHHEEPHREHHEGEDGHDHEEEEKALNQEEFEQACASIVLHLVQGYCIEEGHGHNETQSSLPSREYFIKDLFKEKKYLSEEELEEILKVLNIGKAAETHEGDSHDDHHHRRRRSAGLKSLRQHGSGAPHSVRRREVDDHDHGQTNGASGSCYSLDDMLTVFDVDHSVGADMFDFKELCPAFIQQAKSGACTESSETQPETEKNMGKIWGYSLVAVTLISLTALVGVATIPFFGKRMYKKILATLVALAVGTLAGDSLLHLMPHALGLHAHDDKGGAHDSHEGEDNSFIWKGLVVLAAIYAFFLFETVMRLVLRSKVGGHSPIDVELPGPSSRHTSFKKRRNCSKFEHHEGAPPIAKGDEKPPLGTENGDIVLTNVESAKSELGDGPAVLPQDTTVKPKKTLEQSLSRRSVFSDEEGIKKPLKKISSVAWMIIIGDTLHNISDGLAIGAAFTEGGPSGISGGISTSIAVFCHELPHELGDFAVLLSAGMSVKMALLANLLSAMSCYLGLVIGIVVGENADVRFWIFAIAAGVFLYVALVDMLPELMHNESLQTDPLVTFVCQNIGLLLGISLMLVIALYEEDLMALDL